MAVAPFVGALLVLASCAAERTRSPLASQSGRAEGAAPSEPDAAVSAAFELAFAPDPALQRLIDPVPAARATAWVGGDVASSVGVTPRRFVWLFGDTLLGRVSRRCPRGQSPCRKIDWAHPDASVIPNSVGVMRFDTRGRPAPIVEFWRTEQGAPSPVFAAPEPGEILWPLAAARVGASLVIAASRHSRATGLLPLGNLLLVVRNPEADPRQWDYTTHPLPNVRAGPGEPDPLTWTTALVTEAPYLYVVGQRGVGFEARAVLCRVRLRDVADRDWQPRPEFLVAGAPGADPVWSEVPGTPDAPLFEIPGLPGTSEATFERTGGLGWVTFRIPPLGFEVHAYTAPDLRGPWSDRGIVYRVPPPWSTAAHMDCLTPEAGCGQERFAAYAVKSHPELAPAGGFALSYNVNLLAGSVKAAEQAAAELEGFYMPQMIAGVPLPMGVRDRAPDPRSGQAAVVQPSRESNR